MDDYLKKFPGTYVGDNKELKTDIDKYIRKFKDFDNWKIDGFDNQILIYTLEGKGNGIAITVDNKVNS